MSLGERLLIYGATEFVHPAHDHGHALRAALAGWLLNGLALVFRRRRPPPE